MTLKRLHEPVRSKQVREGPVTGNEKAYLLNTILYIAPL